MSYPHTQLFIHGQWREAAAGETLAVFNPATGQEIGRVAHARQADLDLALDAAWRSGGQTLVQGLGYTADGVAALYAAGAIA